MLFRMLPRAAPKKRSEIRGRLTFGPQVLLGFCTGYRVWQEAPGVAAE